MNTATKPRTINQPASWWDAFNEQAKRDGLQISEWIGKACRRQLDKDLRDLPARPPAHRHAKKK